MNANEKFKKPEPPKTYQIKCLNVGEDLIKTGLSARQMNTWRSTATYLSNDGKQYKTAYGDGENDLIITRIS